MRLASINIPLHMLNTNKRKRVGDRKGWPIQRDLSSPHPDVKTLDTGVRLDETHTL